MFTHRNIVTCLAIISASYFFASCEQPPEIGPMAQIPAGCFDMGDAFSEAAWDELPVHEVCLSAFEIDIHEITNAEYAKCVNDGGCTPPIISSSNTRATYYGDPAYDDFPVLLLVWDQVNDYCAWVGKRLPTEAEWEYAARGGLVGKRYPWGGDSPNYWDDISSTDANYDWNIGDTSMVESYAPNGYGLYDMAGNVWEWVEDDYHGSYDCDANPGAYNCGSGGLAPIDGSAWVDNPRGTDIVLRGGSFWEEAYWQRVANREYFIPAVYYSGGRCAR